MAAFGIQLEALDGEEFRELAQYALGEQNITMSVPSS